METVVLEMMLICSVKGSSPDSQGYKVGIRRRRATIAPDRARLRLGNHEAPWVAEGSEDVLQERMVISI
jgi:hypothetical protein